MTLADYQNYFQEALKESYPNSEIERFFYWLVEASFGYSRFQTSLHKQRVLLAQEKDQFDASLQRLLNYEPIQYIIGSTEFFGLQFVVTPATLIPRPETEELVQWILEDVNSLEQETSRILDIGTGSGCIAISLAKELKNTQVSAVDISEEALAVAAKNAITNNSPVHFEHLDILKTKSLEERYHVIVSNPPYVRMLEKELMQPNVLDHEPETALFVSNEDPLLFYRKIANLGRTALHPNGSIYFEINEYLSKELVDLLKGLRYTKIEVRKDIFGKDRMMKCIYHD